MDGVAPMSRERTGAVALLVDFENLIYGLADSVSEFEPEPLFALSQEYGQVVLAHAYADWRGPIARYQEGLYREGMDLIHVFGKRQGAGFKNAVDVKMAVDAIELVWTLPHIQTFVVVSGDRDFIHLLKSLRRYGKFVVGVSPAASTSVDLADLCDRFVRYESLLNAYDADPAGEPTPTSEYSLEDVRRHLREIVASRPQGLKGAAVKPELRKRLSSTFDENDLGFRRLGDLLAALRDVVRIEPNLTGGDLTLFPAWIPGDPFEEADIAPAASLDRLTSAAGLAEYRFQADPAVRASLMKSLFDALRLDEPVTKTAVIARVLEAEPVPGLSPTVVNKTFQVLYQSHLFVIARDQSDLPAADRSMRLHPAISSAEDLRFLYEAGIVYKLIRAAEVQSMELEPGQILKVLGLAPDAVDYAHRLLQTSRLAPAARLGQDGSAR